MERSPFIVAASDTMLLVKYGEIYYTTNDIGTDGAPYSFTTCRGEYGSFRLRTIWRAVRIGAGDAAGRDLV